MDAFDWNAADSELYAQNPQTYARCLHSVEVPPGMGKERNLSKQNPKGESNPTSFGPFEVGELFAFLFQLRG